MRSTVNRIHTHLDGMLWQPLSSLPLTLVNVPKIACTLDYHSSSQKYGLSTKRVEIRPVCTINVARRLFRVILSRRLQDLTAA